jgi:hypothetical protein
MVLDDIDYVKRCIDQRLNLDEDRKRENGGVWRLIEDCI